MRLFFIFFLLFLWGHFSFLKVMVSSLFYLWKLRLIIRDWHLWYIINTILLIIISFINVHHHSFIVIILLIKLISSNLIVVVWIIFFRGILIHWNIWFRSFHSWLWKRTLNKFISVKIFNFRALQLLVFRVFFIRIMIWFCIITVFIPFILQLYIVINLFSINLEFMFEFFFNF